MAAFDRQFKESGPAWLSFVAFRDLGPERTIAKAAAKVGKSPRTLEKWAQVWGWAERARLWDVEQDRLVQQARHEERLKMLDRQAAMSVSGQIKLVKMLNEMDTVGVS